jgi:phosphonate transport system permease protein
MPSTPPPITDLPPRFRRPSLFVWGISLGFLALFIQGVMATNVTLERLIRGATNLGHFIGRAFPPDLSNLDVLAWSMYETLNIAIVGVTLGVILSVPFIPPPPRGCAPLHG